MLSVGCGHVAAKKTFIVLFLLLLFFFKLEISQLRFAKFPLNVGQLLVEVYFKLVWNKIGCASVHALATGETKTQLS